MARSKSAAVTMGVEVTGLKETLRAFNTLGKEASKELRKASTDIAQGTAAQAVSRANSLGGVAEAAARSVRARSDRAPKIVSGGSKKVTTRKTSAGSIFFGAEFGGRTRASTLQFKQHLGQQGYFLWPTIRARKSQDIARYQRALDTLIRKWSRGG